MRGAVAVHGSKDALVDVYGIFAEEIKLARLWCLQEVTEVLILVRQFSSLIFVGCPRQEVDRFSAWCSVEAARCLLRGSLGWRRGCVVASWCGGALRSLRFSCGWDHSFRRRFFACCL